LASNYYKNKNKSRRHPQKKALKNCRFKNLNILTFWTSFWMIFFFQPRCFSERNSDIQPVSENFTQKYTENFWNVAALFFLLRKKICKNKKYLPTTPTKESALIPIVSDRDPTFTSNFWQELFKLQGTQLHLSSAYHP
jgi:hypothetical protein